jgi:hypothetical protein
VSDLREQLQGIYDHHGKLTPELVVEVARPTDHPLHDRVFDRSPREAAETYYRNRAHELIQSVRVVYAKTSDASQEQSVRAFHAVRREKAYSYEPVEKIAEDEFTKRLVLSDMEREWRQLLARYEQFEEFLGMVQKDLAERNAA